MRHVDVGFFNPEGPLTIDAYVASGQKLPLEAMQ
jgi:hypothetical protein